MSSIMRRRNGLMGFSLIGGSCLEVGVLDPSILKTETRPVIRAQSKWLPASRHTASVRAAYSRGSGFVLWPEPDLRPWRVC